MDPLAISTTEKIHLLALRAVEMIPRDLNMAFRYIRAALKPNPDQPSTLVRSAAMACLEAAHMTCQYTHRFQFGGPVLDAGLSPNGKYLFTIGQDQEVRLWSMEGKELCRFEDPESDLQTVCFSAGSDQLLTAAVNGALRIVTMEGKFLKNLPQPFDSLSGALWDPANELILCADQGGKVVLLTAKGIKLGEVELSAGDDQIVAMDWSEDGQIWMAVSTGRKALFGNRNGKVLKSAEIGVWGIEDAKMDPRGNRILVWGEDCPAELIALGRDESMRLEGQKGGVKAAWFSKNGEAIFTAGADFSLWQWEVHEDGPEGFVFGEVGDTRHLLTDESGKLILTLSEDDKLRSWREFGLSWYQCSGLLWNTAFLLGDPATGPLITIDQQGGGYQWETQPGMITEIATPNFSIGTEGYAFDLGTETGLIACNTFEAGKIQLIRQGDLQARDLGWEAHVEILKFSPTQSKLLVGGADGRLELLAMPEGTVIHTWKFDESAFEIQFNPSKKTAVISNGKSELYLLDLETGRSQVFSTKKDAAISRCLFHPAGNQFLSFGTEGSAALWHSDRGFQSLLKIKGGAKVSAACFLESADQWICGDEAGNLHAFSTKGKRIWSKPAHEKEIRSLQVHPDGTTLLSAGLDGKAMLWDVTGELLKSYGKFRSLMWAIWSPGGRELLASGDEYPVLFSLDGTRLGQYPVYLTSDRQDAFFSRDGKQIWFFWNNGELIKRMPTVYGI